MKPLLPRESEVQGSLAGTQVGNYLVIRLLGAGAMGEVYLGEHPKIGRQVAIKVLKKGLFDLEEVAERFIAEARAVNKIKHPNIIQIFDFGTLADGRLYYTMEYLEGEELSGLIDQQAPLSLQVTDDVVKPIAAALDMAHSVGIVHRDLKPENIFLSTGTGAGTVVRILDFGIAKVLEPDLGSQLKTATGMIMGTPMYMSPEQAAGQINVISPRSDIYSLAVIMYQMLSGHYPINARTAAQVLAKHISEPPAPLADVAPGLPRAVPQVIEKSLAKAPEERHQRAGDLYHEFHEAWCNAALDQTAVAAVRQDGDHEAHREPILKTTLGSCATESLAASSLSRSRADRRGLQMIRMAVVLCLLAGGAVAAYLIVRPDTSRTTKLRQGTSAAGAVKEPRQTDRAEPMSAEKAPTTAQQLRFHVRVAPSARGVRVQVTVNGHQRFVREPPFSVEVLKGQEITLRARRPGYPDHVKTWSVAGDREVVLSWKGRKHGMRRLGRQVTMKPRPMGPIMSPPMPPPRRVMKAYGEGTVPSPY